jgi:uncharacterized membrane protein
VSARAKFLTSLRAGLRGLPAAELDEIVADYTAHFDEGAAANRGETEIASSLGDPLALADELRMNFRVASFEASPSPRSASQVVAGVIALGAINTVLLCVAAPLLAFATLGSIFAILVLLGTGLWCLFAGASLELPGGPGTTVLCGLGLIAAAVSTTALLLLAGKLLISGIGRYARLKFRLLPRVPPPGKSS